LLSIFADCCTRLEENGYFGALMHTPVSQPVTHLQGVGPQVAARLKKLGIECVAELLFHLPLRYQDRTRIQPIRDLKAGDYAVVEAVVEANEIRHSSRQKMLLVLVRDDCGGGLMLRFFHFSDTQRQQLQPGTVVRCFGEVRDGYDCLELVHPEYRCINPEHPPQIEEALTPVYPLSEGLNQNQLRRLTEQALAYEMPEYLPLTLRQQYQLPELNDALRLVHRPPPHVDTTALLEMRHPAQRRLAFEELLAQHLGLRLLRAKAQQVTAPSINADTPLCQHFLSTLPFTLTAAQQRVDAEIGADLHTDKPMQRLVQGDVGSGKTVIAALAAVRAVASGVQVAIMAPTELLAEQHLHNFKTWFSPLGLHTAWLSGSLGRKQRRETLAEVASGVAQIIIGTHALFQEEVQFARLGLVIVDEQHRFGVHQRLALRDKGNADGSHPHQLIMTATPIPRTLAMTAYADLDISVIDELPPGRSPVITVVISNHRREEVMARVAHACAEKKQAYWVCPLIEESEVLQCQAAEDSATQLAAALPDVRVGLIHGRLKSKEKETLMAAFKNAEIDVLVATTVIEVGVDVPNASLMIIENAERMGLAQLHQLRGRVGRGAAQSYCVLLYQHPLSENSKARLAALRDSQDGFYIARRDLELRGPGELLGTRQTGLVQFRIADLQRDEDLLPQIASAAQALLHENPDNAHALVRRWLKDGFVYGGVF
jgi:ATP-dependent DNA helicase RecG